MEGPSPNTVTPGDDIIFQAIQEHSPDHPRGPALQGPSFPPALSSKCMEFCDVTYLLVLITKQNFITVQAGSRKAAHSHLAVGGQIETQIMNLFDSFFISLALLNMP